MTNNGEVRSYSGSIVIPESVTYEGVEYRVISIGYYAFEDCIRLTEVYCLADNVPETGYDIFHNTLPYSYISNSTLYVPESAIEQYKTTEPWSGFGTIVGLTQDMIDSIQEIKNESLTPTLSKGEGDWYSLDGKMFNKPQRGINILRYSDGTSKKVLIK